MTKSSNKSKPKIRILLADDHKLVREGIRQLVEGAGDLRVIAEAGDGKEAEALIQSQKPDVAVLDIQMPKASGIEVTRWVRANHPDVGVLILTAYDDDPYVMAVLQAGANGYLLKTAAVEELVQAVRDVNDGKSALSQTITQKVIDNLSKRNDPGNIEFLTDREMDVLRLAAKGFTNKAIGVQLGISDRTVQGHLAHIFDKIQASSRTEAVMRAVSLGWIPQSSGEMSKE
jgi:NarL family two-component system response regulator LiaR